MAAITLKNIPKDLHRDIKMLQMDLDDDGKKMNLEEIYLMLVEKGLKQQKQENLDAARDFLEKNSKT